MPNIPEIQIDGVTYKIKDTDCRNNVEDLQSVIRAEDLFVNDTLSYVNYDYDTPFYQEESSSGSWQKKTGVDRDGQVIVLNRHTSYSSIIRIKVSGEIEFAASNSGVDAWSSGISLITGHKYVAKTKLISGTSYTSDQSVVVIPNIYVYKTGTHSNVGTNSLSGAVATNTFTAEENAAYNICLVIDSVSWTMTNAKFLVTLIDMTTSRIDQAEAELAEIVPAFSSMFDGRYGVDVIENGTDYNTITTPGTYKVATNANARTMIHCPSSVSHKLYVFRTTASSKFWQVIITDSKFTIIYVRNQRLNDTEGFSSWKYINLTDMENQTTDGVPDYYFDNNYLPDRISEIISHNAETGMRSDQFIFFSDPHSYRDGDITRTQNGLHSVELIKYIASKTNISHVVCGGDLTNGNTMTPAQQITLLSQMRTYLAPIWDHLNMIIGNHEWNNPGQDEEQEENELTISQIYPLLLKDKEQAYGALDTSLGSYWIDNKTQKIRYFYLSCTDGGNINRDSFIWFADQMLEVPDGYTVFVLSHIGLLSDLSYCGRIEQIVGILEAAKAKTGFSYTWPGTSVPITRDYSSLNVTVAGLLAGHIHRDLSKYTDSGIPIITITCDRGPKSDSTNLFKEARAYGTIGEQAIDVVQIDVTNRKIYLTRIGGCIVGAAYDSETGLLYDEEAGTGTEYTGTEWTLYCPYKDREFTF